MQEHPRVALHGAAHVAYQHQAPGLLLAFEPRQIEELAAVPQVSPRRPPKVYRRPSSGNPSSGPPLAELPLKLVHHPPGGVDLPGRELGEVLLAQDLTRAVGTCQVDAVAGSAVRLAVVRGPIARRRGRELRLPEAALLSDGPEVQRGQVVLGRPPEDVERLVEQRQVPVAVYQHRTQRLAKVALAADADYVERVHDVHHPGGVDVQPKAPEHSAEQEEIVQQVAAAVGRRR